MLVLGLDAFTVINSGTTASPVYEEVGPIKDETLNLTTALADVTTRRAKGWRLQVGTLSEGTVDATMLYDTEDAQFLAIQQAFFDKSRVLMGFFDADPNTPPANGLVGGFSVTNFSQNRNLEEALMVDVTFTVREDETGEPPIWAQLV